MSSSDLIMESSKNIKNLQEIQEERKMAFIRMAQTFVRMFYDDFSEGGRGIAVVFVDALTRRQWVSEQDLATDLKLHPRQVRRTLLFLEQERLVFRERIKKGKKNTKLHSHFYYSLDYAQIYDVARYKIHHMKKKLKDELESNNALQDYICTNCGRRYNSLDASWLVSEEDDSFHCENCNGELLAGNARGQRHEKLKDLFQRLEVQLKPLMEQIDGLKDLDIPMLGTLQAWEAQASAAGCPANGDSNKSER